VATPIGNLEDVSLRALRLLGEVALIAAEDTRHTRRLLARHGIATPLAASHQHSSPRATAALVARLDEGDIALVTDAGTPGVSDPGSSLVAAARAAGHHVIPIPGPSAVAAALSASGLPADRYSFAGFLPKKAAERRSAIAALADRPETLVLFEAPNRVGATLADLANGLGTGRPASAGS
jgi:16S rRNA (cytidine1402-2'-O)-methyltransferase